MSYLDDGGGKARDVVPPVGLPGQPQRPALELREAVHERQEELVGIRCRALVAWMPHKEVGEGRGGGGGGEEEEEEEEGVLLGRDQLVESITGECPSHLMGLVVPRALQTLAKGERR